MVSVFPNSGCYRHCLVLFKQVTRVTETSSPHRTILTEYVNGPRDPLLLQQVEFLIGEGCQSACHSKRIASIKNKRRMKPLNTWYVYEITMELYTRTRHVLAQRWDQLRVFLHSRPQLRTDVHLVHAILWLDIIRRTKPVWPDTENIENYQKLEAVRNGLTFCEMKDPSVCRALLTSPEHLAWSQIHHQKDRLAGHGASQFVYHMCPSMRDFTVRLMWQLRAIGHGSM